MPLSGMLTCGNCGTRAQMNTMRYNLGGSRLICQNCVDKERGGIKPGTTHSTSVRLRQQHEQLRQEAPPAPTPASTTHVHGAINAGTGMANYYCKSCHFRFARKKDFESTTCPYCGRDAVSPTYEGKAQDLIEESTEMEGDLFRI